VTCIPAIPTSCLGSIGDGLGSVASNALGNGFADAMRDGAAWVVRTTVGWWIEVPPIDLANSPAQTIRGYVIWLAMVVAAAGIMWRGVLLAVSRRSHHVLDVGRGLFVFVLWAAIGIVGPAAALTAGDAFSTWVLDRASSGQLSERLVQLAGLQTVTSPGAVIVLGLLLMGAGLVQAVLMVFREGSIVVLSGVIVLAASGQFVRATRSWLSKVIGRLLALICFKPAAALVYASALAMVGEGTDPRTVLVGITMLLMAIFTLPMLMKLFTWATGAATEGGGGMATLMAASASAIHATATIKSSSRSGSDQARHISQDMGSLGAMPTPSPVSWKVGAPSAAGAGPTAAASAELAAAAGPVGLAVVGAQLAGTGASAAARAVDGAMNEGDKA
jgi:hypothetical protein